MAAWQGKAVRKPVYSYALALMPHNKTHLIYIHMQRINWTFEHIAITGVKNSRLFPASTVLIYIIISYTFTCLSGMSCILYSLARHDHLLANAVPVLLLGRVTILHNTKQDIYTGGRLISYSLCSRLFPGSPAIAGPTNKRMNSSTLDLSISLERDLLSRGVASTF